MKKTLTTGWECPENENECLCVINDPKLSQYRVEQYLTTGKHTMKTLDKQIPSNLTKNMFEHSIPQTTVTTQKHRKLFSKHKEIKLDRENPYLFLEDWRRNDAKMEFEECLGKFQWRKKW